MARYKLTYFDFPGSRGEECRLALHLAGEGFDDDRLAGDAWSKVKATTPYGSLPVLTVEGRGVLAQSNAILSYIGRAHGLLPTDAFECARHEAVMCSVEDFRAHLAATGRPDPEQKKLAREAFTSGYLATWAAAIERQLDQPGDQAVSPGPFFGGLLISVADLKLYMIMRSIKDGGIDHVPTTAFDAYSGLSRLYDAVATHPLVAAWTKR